MKQNKARDFLLLAAVAYQNKMYDRVGVLFATAMESDDCSELLANLCLEAGASGDEGVAQASDAPRVGLRAIAESISRSLSGVSLSAAADDSESDEDEDEDSGELTAIEDNIEEDGDDNEDDDGTTDDFSEIPGQKVIPSSLSGDHQGGDSANGIKLVKVISTPIHVK